MTSFLFIFIFTPFKQVFWKSKMSFAILIFKMKGWSKQDNSDIANGISNY